jgi:hypothetical protein
MTDSGEFLMGVTLMSMIASAQTGSRAGTAGLAVMRLRPLVLGAAVLLIGCAADDGFRARLAQGCRSEMECSQLVMQADARTGSCQRTDDPNIVLHLRLDLRPSAAPCDEVEADRRVARGYLDWFSRERERQAAWFAEQQAANRQQESALQQAEQERSRAAEEAERRRREDEAWAAQRPLSCASGESEPACDGLRAFLAVSPGGAHAVEARAALDSQAQLTIQRLDAKYRADRAAREKADRDAASQPRPTPVAPVTSTRPETGGHVCCCDGTASPTCTTVHRGCCSHHGGVCACD